MAAERYDAATMADGSVWEIDDGWDVIGVDGEKAGVVSDIEPDYIVVSRGIVFTTEYFVPVDTITNVAPGRVYLNVSRRDIEERGWTTAPVATDRVLSVGYDNLAPVSGGDRVPDDALERRLADERILIDRQPVETLDGSDDEDGVRSFAHVRLDVPVYGEVAAVRKRPVVYEMFSIVRGIRERRQQFRDVVRREDVVIDIEESGKWTMPDARAGSESVPPAP